MSHWKLSLVLSICTSFVTLLCVSAQSEIFIDSDISRRFLPAYAIASDANLLNSTCGKELQDFRNAIDHRIRWSLKMLDSSGGPKPGFIYGNNLWLGSRSQCQDIMNPITPDKLMSGRSNNTLDIVPDLQEELPPFKVNYFVARLKYNSTLQYHIKLFSEDLITLGLCLPASCSKNDINFILEGIFNNRTLFIGDLYSLDFKVAEIRDLNDNHLLFSGEVLLIGFVLIFTCCLMTVATIYDIFVYQKYLKAKNNLRICDKSKDMNNETQIQRNSNEETIPVEMEIENPSQRESKIAQVLICFSAYTNTRIIFDTKLQADSLPVIHGIKFISMIWIIIVHAFFFLSDYIDNKIWILRFSDKFAAQIFNNPLFMVDSYFFLSGFLLAYQYLKNAKSQTEVNCRIKLNEFLFTVIKRFIRLTPAYMMILGIVILSSSWHGKFLQFYTDERLHETCTKYWWRNLLYINNLFSHKTDCMSWCWYLSNDMQYYIIGLSLLILSSTYFYTAVVLLGALLIGSIMITGYISYVYEYVPTLEEQYRLFDVLYVPPWTRIGPHIIGIITAYIITKLNKTLILRKRTIILCWCLASACNVSVLFIPYERHISVLTASFYIALSRTIWAIGLAWILIACCTHHAGIVNQLLSFNGWIPLSRLTYCAYLVNPLIIGFIGLHSELSIHLEALSFGIICFGYCVISFLCAYVLSLMSEMPYISLMQMFAESRRKSDKLNNFADNSKVKIL